MIETALLEDGEKTHNSYSSETPPDTVSDPWTVSITEFITELKAKANKKSKLHELAGHYFRNMEVRWVLPSILVPTIFGPVVLLISNITYDNDEVVTTADYISTTGFILTSVLTSVSNFYRYGTRSQDHHTYSAKYSDIVTDIESELIKKKKFRTNADVFVTTMKMKFDNLVFGEPVIPLHISKSK